ncbi:MAG TPA: LysM peptidoglycan-binding domain-containing protein [Burkholderiales bacterium]
MEPTRTKKRLFTLSLTFGAALIFGGCASVPDEPASAASADPARKVVSDDNPGMPTAKTAGSADTAESTPTPAAVNEESTTSASAQGDRIVDDESAASARAVEPETLATQSIWARIRAGLRLPPVDAELTAQHEQWFIENAEFREALFDRAKLYLYYIVEEVDKRGMPMEVALLPAIESAYKPYAYSRARASGLWQFIPSTGRLYGLKKNWWYDGRRDVVASTRAALDYLQKLQNDFDGDWQLALAAYNAGEGRVMRAIEWNRRRHLPTDFKHLRQLKRETKHYVPKLMAMVNIVTDPARFGVTLPDIPNEPYFTRVEAGSQVDLGVVARLTGMEVDDLHFINPGYIRRATDPNGPHHILVPVDMKDAVVTGLSEMPETQRVQWQHHQVRRGETLYDIARRYRLTVEAIKTANNLRSSRLRIGQSLMLPISASAYPTGVKPVRITIHGDDPIIHRVRHGETLSSIARRYNVLVRQLAEWNLMRPNDILQLGRKLKIWNGDGPQARLYNPPSSVYA